MRFNMKNLYVLWSKGEIYKFYLNFIAPVDCLHITLIYRHYVAHIILRILQIFIAICILLTVIIYVDIIYIYKYVY
jgi:hypothetical protein